MNSSNTKYSTDNILFHVDNLDLLKMLCSKQPNSLSLIYADPPYNVGVDFKAFDDRWSCDEEYYAFMKERIILFRELLADHGSLYLHTDYRTASYLRVILDEVFGVKNYINECIWFYKTGGMPQKIGFGRKHDTIHFVTKNKKQAIWNPQKEKSYLTHKYGFKNIEIFEDQNGFYREVAMRDVWDIPGLRGNQAERNGYPTQKPEQLLERIIQASSNPGDCIADFFCGSGTTGAVASRLQRKWIMCDQGLQAIETTRERLEAQAVDFEYRETLT